MSAQPQRTRQIICCLLFSLLLAMAGFAESSKAKTVVSGLVRVASQDSKGNILSIEILVGETEQEPYLVSDTAKGKELRKHVGEWVIVAGVVSEDALGWKTIEVTNFQLADDLKGWNCSHWLACR